jgi:hypothetical protein
LSTSDGLGICRKREEGEDSEAASVGSEHDYLKKLRGKLEFVKVRK